MVLSVFLDFISKLEKTPERAVLERIASLHGAHVLQRHIALFFEVKIDSISNNMDNMKQFYLKRNDSF